MAKVELKKPVVEEISNLVNGSAAAVLVNYSGLTVAQDTELRKSLREAGVTYKVYKNTMMNFAFKGTEFESLCDKLNGTNALAVSKDEATAPARVLADFAKKNPKLELIAGVVDGEFYDAAGVQALASIPSKEVLLSRLLGSMQGTIAGFARVIKAIADQDGEAAAEAPAAE
ncbi:MAG: 50S ribosomal protein L10 [Eubacteriales bacterium]|nr:50S ribosomal protein L10 [Eubacteriales bacterium]